MEYGKTVLPNKVTILTIPVKNVSHVNVGVFIRAGTKHETEELNGISHFLEHMVFKGTKKRTSYEVTETAEYVGAEMNAHTSNDHTAYHMEVLPEHTTLALDILSDITQNPIFPQDELEIEKNVVIQEIHRYSDDPSHLAKTNLDRLSFPNQSHGFDILGPEENIKKFTREDLLSYVEKYYVGANTVVIGVGDIDHDEFVSKSVPFFENLKAGKSNDSLITAAFSSPFVYQNNPKNFTQTTLMTSYALGLDKNDPYRLKHKLLSNVLCGSLTAPLFYTIREKHGLAYALGSYVLSTPDLGTFDIYVGTTSKHVEQVFDDINTELSRLSETITERELTKAKNILKSGSLKVKESPHNLMVNLGSNYMQYGEVVDIDDKVSKLLSVGKEELLFASAQLHSPRISIIGPIEHSTDYYAKKMGV